jgi:hypothetical protein
MRVHLTDKHVHTNRQIFPTYSSAQRSVSKNSALARIKEKRAELKALSLNNDS